MNPTADTGSNSWQECLNQSVTWKDGHLPLTTSLNTGVRCFPREKNLDNELERVFIFFFSEIDCSQLSWTPKSKTSESCGASPGLRSDCEPEDADSTGEVNEGTGRAQLSKIKPLKLNNLKNKQINL